MSIVFDRAVEFYDQTRGLPEQVADLPAKVLVRETGLTPESEVLEIGIGTGRIGLSTANLLGHVTGIDLSMKMMGLIAAKLSGASIRVDLAQADVVQLPFPAHTFDVVYAVHVLHLVNGWRAAVGEARRVIKPNGYFVVSWHRRQNDSPNVLLRRELSRLAAAEGIDTKRPGAQSEAEILEELEDWQAEANIVDVADWIESSRPREVIDDLDRQINSETWSIPRVVMDRVIPRLRDWGESTFGSLDRVIVTPYNFRWLFVRKAQT